MSTEISDSLAALEQDRKSLNRPSRNEIHFTLTSEDGSVEIVIVEEDRNQWRKSETANWDDGGASKLTSIDHARY